MTKRTKENIATGLPDPRRAWPTAQLDALCEIKSAHPPSTDWWFFPGEDENKVQGFLGTGKIFIVGDQPSRDDWPYEHEHRRAFYNLLKEESAGDCHLTDFYKRRGLRGELKNGFDPVKHPDSAEQVFRWEVELLRPSTILAMGRIAERAAENAHRLQH